LLCKSTPAINVLVILVSFQFFVVCFFDPTTTFYRKETFLRHSALNVYQSYGGVELPLFAKGRISPNFGMILGLSPESSVLLFYVVLIAAIWWTWRHLTVETQIVSTETDTSNGIPYTRVPQGLE
jgi:hypothetical protein